MEWKSYIFGIISSVVASLIVIAILRYFSKRKPSKTQLSAIFSANSKFRGYKDAYRIIMSDNTKEIDIRKNKIINHLDGHKTEAQKMIAKKTHIHIANKIIKLCESKSVNELLEYFNKIVPKLQKYYDKWIREFD